MSEYYNDLVNGISIQLVFNCTRKRMKIRYTMEDKLNPMKIQNDMGMRFFYRIEKTSNKLRVVSILHNNKRSLWYENYRIDEILLRDSANYNDLMVHISKQLKSVVLGKKWKLNTQ